MVTLKHPSSSPSLPFAFATAQYLFNFLPQKIRLTTQIVMFSQGCILFAICWRQRLARLGELGQEDSWLGWGLLQQIQCAQIQLYYLFDNQIIYNSVNYIFSDIVQDENCGRFNQRGVVRQSSCNERRYRAIWKKVTAANRNSFGDVED